jgi:ribonuclease HIII
MFSLPYVVQLPKPQWQKLKRGLEEQGFILSTPAHTVFQGRKKGVTCTLYASGKLVIQGKEAEPFIQFYLEPEITLVFLSGNDHLNLDKTPRIGVDEAGKGDFFGPLCIAAVFGDSDSIEHLMQIGVKDSKKLTDQAIAKIAQKIRSSAPYYIVRIGPLKYNQLYPKFYNLNHFLAWGHATAIENLSKITGCKRAHIDQFTKEPLVKKFLTQKQLDIDFSQKTQGENDPVVAAASILARDAFVSGMKLLSDSIGWELPKGASSKVIVAGKKLLKEKGASVFEQVAKKHFKTLDEILKNTQE